uniref:hypothetical protein 30 n=1 Tax=Moniliophthora perniciosa TaxID=153609 RepID=UPI0000242377|nr:hypothetical protein 30 [Moniliophthora perniciosa]AAQ74320.1 hypothetical protein 30 [Moniliophthora perniciosa]
MPPSVSCCFLSLPSGFTAHPSTASQPEGGVLSCFFFRSADKRKEKHARKKKQGKESKRCFPFLRIRSSKVKKLNTFILATFECSWLANSFFFLIIIKN